MEQSIRLILTDDKKPTESSLIAIYSKLTSPQCEHFSSDLLILLAERFCDLPKPYNRQNIERAEKIIQMHSILQEPLNQFQVRSLIVQAIFASFHATQERGSSARDFNLKALDLLSRALKIITEKPIYQPLSLRLCFVLYDIATPFFPNEERGNLSQVLYLAVPLLELHVTQKFDATMKLYIAFCLLYGCTLDDAGKSDEASKLIAKLFTKVPTALIQLRYSLLHIYAHFSRKSPGPLLKTKLELNEQIQKAIILYQVVRSTGQTNSKDLLEAFKILTNFLDTKKDALDDCAAAEITIGEIGRYAVQIGQIQLANDCQQRVSGARAANARLNALMITAEINLSKQLDNSERAENASNLLHIMNLALTQGDAVIIQDAATDLWSYSLLLFDEPSLIKKSLVGALEILSKMDSQVNVLRSQMHFALAKIFIEDREYMKAVDHLNKAMSLDYYVMNHPTKLVHPFDRYLIPATKMLEVFSDPNSPQIDNISKAEHFLVQKKVTKEGLESALEILRTLSETAASMPSDEAAHLAIVFYDLIKQAFQNGEYEFAVSSCIFFLQISWDTIVYDYAVEIQCNAAAVAVQSVFKLPNRPVEKAVEFVNFSIEKMKELKKCQFPASGPPQVWNMMYIKQIEEIVAPQAAYKKGASNTGNGTSMKNSGPINTPDSSDPSYGLASQVFSIRKSMFGFNTIIALWDSFLAHQSPADCQNYVEFIGECVQHLFDMIDFYPAHALIGGITNLYVSILLLQCVESQPQVATQQKKKASSLDPQKQKLLKLAEDATMKALPLVVSISEKKALVDRLVEIFAKKNALPPNQSDPDISNLITLATIMNEKVQHKAEILAQMFSTLTDPTMFALLSERAMKIDMHQIAIDSAVKTIDVLSNPKGKDDLYYLGLAHFCRGMTFLKLIQPGLQEFSCQDNLRRDASLDFLKSAQYFYKAKSINNAKQSLEFFTATVCEGEKYAKFRVMLVSHLQEATKLAKTIGLSDDLSARLYKIFILALSDQNEWKLARKVMQEAISTLNRKVHCQLWELNIIITANLECSKSQMPLLDDLLSVKQLGDSKYQSRLYTFVADLATEKQVQNIALQKAIDSLLPADVQELFNANLNYAKWLTKNDGDPKYINEILDKAEDVIKDKPTNEVNSCKIHLIHFELTTTNEKDRFNEVAGNAIELADDLWEQIAALNAIQEEDDDQKKAKTKQAKPVHKAATAPTKEATPTVQKDEASVAWWLQTIKTADQVKHIDFQEKPKVVLELLDIIDILSSLGYEFSMLKLWFQVFSIIKSLDSLRFEQFVQLKFRLFLDRLNVLTNQTIIPYPTEYILTENEKYEWSQIVGRYKTDPESDIPPLRILLLKCADIEAEFGEYKNVLTIVTICMQQAEQMNDLSTIANCKRLLALVESRSGNSAKATALLQEAAKGGKMPFSFWCEWFKVAFSVVGNPKLIPVLINNAMTQLNPSSIQEVIMLNNMFKYSAQFADPCDCETILHDFDPDPHFLPGMDLTITYLWKCLENPQFPGRLDKFRDIGNKIKDLIQISEDKYSDSEAVKGSSLPFLTRYVETINLFGALVVRFNPVIAKIEREGIDYDAIGSHSSLYTEFVDKTQEPLQDLSPSAAVFYFHAIQHIPEIPKRLKTDLIHYMSQCLHLVADDNVTLQNTVKYMIQAIQLLIEYNMYQQAGEIAIELFEILKSTDISGAIYQFLIAQSAAAYLSRREELYTAAVDKREILFLKESERLMKTLFMPESSKMFETTKQYFSKVECITSPVLFNSITLEEIRNFCLSKKVTLCIIDDLSQGLECSVISFSEKDSYTSTMLDIDLEDISLRFDIFKQIIAPPKAEIAEDQSKSQLTMILKAGGKKSKKTPTKSPKSQMSSASSETASCFARDAMKLNHPEFQKFVAELDESFSCIKTILPENDFENVLILSSDHRVHEIPFECINAFNRYAVIYRDFSIASAIHKASKASIITPNVSKATNLTFVK